MADQALLALEDGSLFYGTAISDSGEAVGEVIFNTGITGYQEILTDPSYFKQIVTLTSPHIGNVGTNSEDEESKQIYAAGLIIRDLSMVMSNWRAQESLSDYLKRHNTVGIANIDTRQLTRHLRKHGAIKGCIVAGDVIDNEHAIATAKAFSGLAGLDLAKEVTTSAPYSWDQGSYHLNTPTEKSTLQWRVTVYDFGVKQNMLRMLVDLGCDLTVVPATTSADEVLKGQPDAILLSNGPGDPAPCHYALETITQLINTGIPLFGICLGYQLLALALGAKIIKMKFGHHGCNHPIQSLADGTVLISSQNHGFAVDEDSLPESLLVTYRSLFDGSLQGIRHKDYPIFGVQGHPEASPGPHDLYPFFQDFIKSIQQYKQH